MNLDIESAILQILDDHIAYNKYGKALMEIYDAIDYQVDWKNSAYGNRAYTIMSKLAYDYKYMDLYEIKDELARVKRTLRTYNEENL